MLSNKPLLVAVFVLALSILTYSKPVENNEFNELINELNNVDNIMKDNEEANDDDDDDKNDDGDSDDGEDGLSLRDEIKNATAASLTNTTANLKEEPKISNATTKPVESNNPKEELKPLTETKGEVAVGQRLTSEQGTPIQSLVNNTPANITPGKADQQVSVSPSEKDSGKLVEAAPKVPNNSQPDEKQGEEKLSETHTKSDIAEKGNKEEDQDEEVDKDGESGSGDSEDTPESPELSDQEKSTEVNHAPEAEDNEEPERESASEENSSSETEEENKDDKVKMFFISPFEKSSDDEEQDDSPATARQILTYPATGHGWGHSHQWGPSHIWNSDYPYFAYGYSWGCGGHPHGGHGTNKKSIVNESGKKSDLLCRDYVLLPAMPKSAIVAPTDDQENGVARQNVVSNDVACNDKDPLCSQRQVIGSMAGGSMFGDGMGGLGMGFPGVPGIHTGISGYNEAGGFGDHSGGHGGGLGGGYGGQGEHGGMGGGGHHGGFGEMDMSHFFEGKDHGFSSYWGGRNTIPREEPEEVEEQAEKKGNVKKNRRTKKKSFLHGFNGNTFGGNAFGRNGNSVAFGRPGNGFAGNSFGGNPAFSEGVLESGGSLGGPDRIDHFAGDNEIGHNFGGQQGWGTFGSGGLRQGVLTARTPPGFNPGNNYLEGDHSAELDLEENGGYHNSAVGHGFGAPYLGGVRNVYGNGLEAVDGGTLDEGVGTAKGYGISSHSPYGPMGMEPVGSIAPYGVTALGNRLGGGMKVGYGGSYGLQGTIDVLGTHSNFAYKSKIKKKKKGKFNKKSVRGTTRQDIAMPDEQAMMDVTKQRQLIGSLGASTLFADNVGGMGLGHPGVPQMSSGVAGIPGEYGGSGGYSHGWEGEGPGMHPHGYNNYGYGGGEHEEEEHSGGYGRSEQPDEVQQDGQREITNRQVIAGLPNGQIGSESVTIPAQGFEGGSMVGFNGDNNIMDIGGERHDSHARFNPLHHHVVSNDDDVSNFDGDHHSHPQYIRYDSLLEHDNHDFDPLKPHHVHVGVGTPSVKVEVETSKSEITRSPAVHVSAQKMNEIKKLVHEVSDSLAKTNEKLKGLKKSHTSKSGKRQITPAFTPVVSEPVGVPDIRYPVPAADRYPLGAGYIWPSANYGHQYGGPYAWSKSNTPKQKGKKEKMSTKKAHKSKGKHRRSIEKLGHKKSEKVGTKRQFLEHPMYGHGGGAGGTGYPYHGGMEMSPEQDGGPTSMIAMSRSQMPDQAMPGGMPVPEPQQAMFAPQGMTPYGADLRAMEYPGSKKSVVPASKLGKLVKKVHHG